MIRVERKPSKVSVEKIHTDTPVAVWYGDPELKLQIGDVRVPAIAFKITKPVEDYSVDFVATGVKSIVDVLGESRIDRIVVYERQPMTIAVFEPRLVSSSIEVGEEDEEPRFGPPMIEPKQYCHHGRYGFVAYLR